MKTALNFFKYIKARLGEKTTWAAISAAAITASTVSEPWNYGVFVCSALVALVPSDKLKPAKKTSDE